MGGSVTQQNRLAFPSKQRPCDRHSFAIGLSLGRCCNTFLLRNSSGNVSQRLGPIGGRHYRMHCRHGPIVGLGIDREHLRTLAGGLADALRKQRVILAQVRTQHQNRLELRQGCDGQTKPAHALKRRKLGIAQAVIDVVATDTAHQCAGQVQLFQRAVRAHQRTDGACAMLVTHALQAVGDVFQGRLPVNFLPLPTLLQHGAGQTFFTIQRLVGEAITVCDPALVHGFVLERNDAHDFVVLHLNDEVGSRRIVGRHRLATRKFPGACTVAEGLARQRAHRAHVDHVARELGIDRIALDRGNLGVLAPIDHTQLHDAADLLAEAHTARAMDATRHLFGGDQWADVLGRDHALFFTIAGRRCTVTHREILQLALTALVADRAVQRVVDEQKLHHRLLRFDGLVGLGAHDHALRHRCGTGRHGLGRLLDVNKAHAAAGSNRQLLVVTEMGNVDVGFFRRMDHHAAFANLHLLTVQFNFNHMLSRNQAAEALVAA